MKFKEVITHTIAQHRAGNAVIWISDPGMGKTYQSKLLFERYASEGKAKGERWGFARFFMATYEPTDFTGLPWPVKNEYTMPDGSVREITITRNAVPPWYLCIDPDKPQDGPIYPAFLFDKVLLVGEEWGQGSLEAKRAGANVVHELGTPPYFLPQGSHVLLLTNKDARDGITKEFNFFIRRRKEFELTRSAKGWDEEFASKPYMHDGKQWSVLPEFRAWALANEAILYESPPKVQGPWCSPASLTDASRYAEVIKGDNNGRIPFDDAGFISGLAGTVGMPATQSVLNTLQAEIDLPSVEDIIADPGGVPLLTRPDLQYLLIFKMVSQVEPRQLGPALQYVSRYNEDLCQTFVMDMLRKDYDAFIDTPAMQGWMNKNATRYALISSLS